MKSPTATPQSLNATLARIKASLRVIPDEESLGRPVKCVRCQDRGVVEMTGGTFELYGDPERRRRGRRIEASPDAPVYVRCGCLVREEEPEREKGRYE